MPYIFRLSAMYQTVYPGMLFFLSERVLRIALGWLRHNIEALEQVHSNVVTITIACHIINYIVIACCV
jgi:hypothetical protein